MESTFDQGKKVLAEKIKTLTAKFGKKFTIRLDGVPERYQRVYVDAIEGTASASKSIKAFCQMCRGYEKIPDDIRDCVDQMCPLWHRRPYQQKIPGSPIEIK